MTDCDLLRYLERCWTLHPHNVTKSNLFLLHVALMAYIIDIAEGSETQKQFARLALAEAFGRCASSAPPVPFEVVGGKVIRRSGLQKTATDLEPFPARILADAGV